MQLYSVSTFPKQPQFAAKAAKQQSLPSFKMPTDTVTLKKTKFAGDSCEDVGDATGLSNSNDSCC